MLLTLYFIYHGMTGDLSYSTGFLSRWDSWLDMMQPIAARVPFMVTSMHSCLCHLETMHRHRLQPYMLWHTLNIRSTRDT